MIDFHVSSVCALPGLRSISVNTSAVWLLTCQLPHHSSESRTSCTVVSVTCYSFDSPRSILLLVRSDPTETVKRLRSDRDPPIVMVAHNAPTTAGNPPKQQNVQIHTKTTSEQRQYTCSSTTNKRPLPTGIEKGKFALATRKRKKERK